MLSIDSFNKVFIICKDDFSEPISFYLQPILFLTPLEKEGTSMAECYIYVTENYFLKYRRRMNINMIGHKGLKGKIENIIKLIHLHIIIY